MSKNTLGKIYNNKEVVFHQGESGNCMYVILSGKVEILHEHEGNTTRVSTLSEGDIFGEMALFEREPRSATVRTLGEARILTVDKRTFFGRVHEDPSLAFNILKKMSQRISRLNNMVVTNRKGEISDSLAD